MVRKLIVFIFILCNLYAGNSEFMDQSGIKSGFGSIPNKNNNKILIGEKEEKIKEQTTILPETIETEATYSSYEGAEESKERILEKKEFCLKDSNNNENCPSNSMQCNELIEKDKGISTKHEKSIIVNKEKINNEYKCKEGYIDINGLNSEKGQCKKDYIYYSYSCDTEDTNKYGIKWKGTLISTGFDCQGECGPYGCICNEKNPPKENCFRENYSCPFDAKKSCTKMKTNEKVEPIYKGKIFEEGESYLIKEYKEKPKQNGICPQNYIFDGISCKKEYSYYNYNCSPGYKIKTKNSNCFGECGPYGCTCGKEIIENNCEKEYEIDKDNELYSFKDNINYILPEGSFNDEWKNEFFNFISKENNIDNINEINGLNDQLCFNSETKKECITIKNCSFKGKINGKIEKLDIDSNSINYENQKIETNCILNGFVGWSNRISGTTTVFTEKNKLIFYDAFKDKKIGFIEILPKVEIENGFELKGKELFELNNSFNYITDEDFIWFISKKEINKEECSKLSEKYDMKIIDSIITTGLIEKYNNKKRNCILKRKKIELNLVKNENKIGNTIFKCSPLNCLDGKCQKASCPEGYEGYIHTNKEYINYTMCQMQTCDATKEYSPYCGLSKECDVTKNDVLLKEGKCIKANCTTGEYNKNKDKCIEIKCPKEYHVEKDICLKNNISF